jgi:Domain of unknown function (DUF1906)/FG-GAP-like repeat
MGSPPTSVTTGTGTWIWANPFGSVSKSASIGVSNEVDQYRFMADQTGSYTITVSGGTVDSQLRVYNSSGTDLSGIVDHSFAGGTETYTISSYPTATWFYIDVTGFLTGTGSYTLSVSGPAPAPQPSISTPAPTYTGSNSSGSIGYGGDLDYFTITAPSGTSSLNLTVTPVAGLDTYVELYNSGGTLLQTINSGGSGSADSATSIAVSAGATYYVGVSSVSSTATGNYTVNVDFNPDAVQPAEITVLGNAVSIADGDTTPSSSDFTDFGSATQNGTAVQHTFTVRNDGGSTLTTSGLTLPSGFSLVEGLSASITAGNSDTFTVQLDTSSTGTKSGQISFSNNDSDENPFNFSISGTVNATSTPAEITVLGNAVSITDGDTTPSSSDFTDFGSATQGGTAVQHTFTVRNDGGSTLTTSGLTLPSGFSLVEGLSSSIASGGSDTFTVQLDTTSTGTKSGQISFSNNDSDENPFNFSISGTVNAVQPPGNALAGFDSEFFPAHPDTMSWLITHTNLAWCGYYLDAPSQRLDTGWLGQRSYLESLGWKIAPIYVGQQDPSYNGGNLSYAPSSQQGVIDGNDAVAQMGPATAATEVVYDYDTATGHYDIPKTVIQGQGFAAGTTVFLDLEFGLIANSANASADEAYVLSWCQAVANGGYRPGIYCPYSDAAPLATILQQNGLNVVFWVADPNWLINDPTEFTVGPTTFPTPDPSVVSDRFTGSGYAGATAWQYETGYSIQTINGPYNIDLDTSTLYSVPSTPEITVSWGGTGIADGDTTPSSADGTDFGSATQGGAAVQHTFTVTNTGAGTLTTSGLTLPSGFSLVEGLSASIAAGNSDTFTVQLDTSSTGTHSGQISFADNDGDENPFNFSITGTVNATTGAAAPHDFNGDQRSDILLQNANTGDSFIWELNGTSLVGSGYVGWTTGAAWQARGTGDFNGDGRSDILLQNVNTGDSFIWELNGTSLVGSGYVGWTTGPAWQARGTGDFNGDGRSDILLQNVNTGDCFIWELNGTSLVGSGYVGWTTGPAWQARGTGDFNGDGRSDVLLQNVNTGDCFIWELNGTSLVGSGYVGWTTGPAWQARGTGDFNGDGRSDVLLQNVNTGDSFIWELNGTNLVGSGSVGWTPGPDWLIHV